MSDQDDLIEAPQDAAEESGPDNFFIDILTGNKESASARKLPAQKVSHGSSREELINTEHPEYKVFMAVVDRAGVDARGNLLFQRAPDGEELVFDEEVIERVREGGIVTIRRTTRRNRRIHDELPLVAKKYKEFRATGEVTV